MDYNKILKQIKKTPRVHGYTSPLTETRLSSIQGLGLFAKKNIRKGTVVAAWGGRAITKKEIEHLKKEMGYNYALQLYPGFYLAETEISDLDTSDFINHSCSPNCKIVKRFLMVARRDIKKEEELTADFSNHSNKGQKLVCNCGSPNCRKVIYYD